MKRDLLILGIVVLTAFAGFALYKNGFLGEPIVFEKEELAGGKLSVCTGQCLSAKEAYELALKEAKNWRTDAKLSYLESSAELFDDGQSADWALEFESETDRNNYYEIFIIQGEISEDESSIIGSSLSFRPPDNLPENWADSDVVMEKTRAGQNVSFSQIILVNNPDKKEWNWILYPKGTYERIILPIF
jgi:hypothetical protein